MFCSGCQRDLHVARFTIRSNGKRQSRCRECTADQRARHKHGLTLTQKYELAAGNQPKVTPTGPKTRRKTTAA